MSRIFNRPMFKLGGKPNSDGVGITSGLNRQGYEDGTPSNYDQLIKHSKEALENMDNMGKISTPELAIMASNVLGKGGSIYDMITNATEEIMPAYGNYKKVQSTLPAAKANIYKGLTDIDFMKRGLDIKEMAATRQLDKEYAMEINRKADAFLASAKLDAQRAGQELDKAVIAEYEAMKIIALGRAFLSLDEARLQATKLLQKDDEMALVDQDEVDRIVAILTGDRYKMAKGGRVGYAMGMGPVMDQQTEALDIQTPTGNEEIVDTQTEVMQPGASQDPFVLLRARLPKEITDDVVKLIAYNPEAFKDFAAIESQQDVINFNITYGVELVIPTSQV